MDDAGNAPLEFGLNRDDVAPVAGGDDRFLQELGVGAGADEAGEAGLELVVGNFEITPDDGKLRVMSGFFDAP